MESPQPEQPLLPHQAARKSNAALRWAITALVVLVLLGIAWLAWVWYALGDDTASNDLTQNGTTNSLVSTFQECTDLGNPVQRSYPERCTTADGQSFINPTQDTPTNQVVDKPTVTRLTEENIIVITKREDLTKLKDIAPESFINFMAGAVSRNIPTAENCVTGYSVSTISNINVGGAVGSVNASSGQPDDACMQGGARMVWYQQNGSWNSIGMQAIVDCSFVAEAKIYQEFIDTCFNESAEEQVAPNPNGPLVSTN